MPQQAIPTALLFFNVGVELGQLAFVLVVLLSMKALGRLRIRWPVWAWRVPPYAIGTIAACWVIERVAAFVP